MTGVQTCALPISNEGHYVKGLHEPLISRELFDKVQEKIELNAKVKKIAKAKCFREELYLRGLIFCDCLNILTGSASRSKTGKRHFYYHCNHCKKVRLPAQEVHQRVERILDEIKIKRTAKSLFEQILKGELANPAARKKSPERVEEEMKQLELRIKNTEDKLADGQITTSTFHTIVNRYKGDIAALRAELCAGKENASDYNQSLRKGIEFINNLSILYNKTDIQSKRKLLSSTFPEKLIFSKKNSRTPRLNEVIRLILNADKGFEGNIKGQLFKNLELSCQVELQGIEPWSKHIRRKLSTCLFMH